MQLRHIRPHSLEWSEALDDQGGGKKSLETTEASEMERLRLLQATGQLASVAAGPLIHFSAPSTR